VHIGCELSMVGMQGGGDDEGRHGNKGCDETCLTRVAGTFGILASDVCTRLGCHQHGRHTAVTIVVLWHAQERRDSTQVLTVL
jgi:hypothetical protein